MGTEGNDTVEQKITSHFPSLLLSFTLSLSLSLSVTSFSLSLSVLSLSLCHSTSLFIFRFFSLPLSPFIYPSIFVYVSLPLLFSLALPPFVYHRPCLGTEALVPLRNVFSLRHKKLWEGETLRIRERE